MKWWLSFADANGFMGVCIVDAPDFMAAVARSRAAGCNPGGECRGWPLPAEAEGEYPLEQLISREELHAHGDMTIGEMKDEGRELVDPGDLLCDDHNPGPP